jgi:hypothetical protein
VDDGAVQLGSYVWTVPVGAVLQCFVSYDGVAQSHYWVADPKIIPNPRRVAYETFDPGLVALKELIDKVRPRITLVISKL